MAFTPAEIAQITAIVTSVLAEARVKISELPLAGALTREAIFPMVDAGSTQKLPLGRLLADTYSVVPTGQDLRDMDLSTVIDGTGFSTLGVLTPNDGGGGDWVYDAGSVAVDNIGTVIAPDSGVGRFLRVYTGPLNFAWFAVDFTGATDTSGEIQATIDALPAVGGQILSPGGTALLGSSIDVDKKVHIVGQGSAQQGGNIESCPTVFMKAAGLNGPAFNILAQGSILEQLGVDGEAGNTEDGILILANSVTLRHVLVARAGNDGIRIGKDDGVSPAVNCNSWVLDHVTVNQNGRHGLYVNDKLIAAPDANAGSAFSLRATANGGDGIKEQNCFGNTYVGILCEGNTGWGINFDPTAPNSLGATVLGGDSENNGAGGVENVRLGANCLSYLIAISPNIIGAPFVDLGPNNRIIPEGSATANECLYRFVYGESFVGNRKYHAWAADGIDRLRIGWSNAAIESGQVAAQILADSLALRYITRADAGATHAFYAGATNDLLMTIGTEDVKTAKQLTVAGGTAAAPGIRFVSNPTTGLSDPGGPAIEFPVGGVRAAYLDGTVLVLTGGLRVNLAAPTILSGSGAPEGAVTAPPGSEYLRVNPADKDTMLYGKVSGAGNTGWNALAGF